MLIQHHNKEYNVAAAFCVLCFKEPFVTLKCYEDHACCLNDQKLHGPLVHIIHSQQMNLFTLLNSSLVNRGSSPISHPNNSKHTVNLWLIEVAPSPTWEVVHFFHLFLVNISHGQQRFNLVMLLHQTSLRCKNGLESQSPS